MRKSVFPSQPPYRGFIPIEAVCYHCGTRNNLHRHHILAGPLRTLSEREGLWVYLCRDCHEEPFGIHSKRKMPGFRFTDDGHLRWAAQMMWETHQMHLHGISEERARYEWIHLTKTPLQSYEYVHDDNHGMWVVKYGGNG